MNKMNIRTYVYRITIQHNNSGNNGVEGVKTLYCTAACARSKQSWS